VPNSRTTLNSPILQVSAQIKETLHSIREIKYIESRCDHKGGVPKQFLSNSYPIMLKVIYKNAGQTIILPIILATMTMPP
jgi:hypothetical protein